MNGILAINERRSGCRFKTWRPRSRPELQFPIKAGMPAGVAGAAIAAHTYLDPDRVLVAIDPHFFDGLDLAAGGALVPKLPPRARPIPGLAGLDGSGQSLAVHMSHHQQLTRPGVCGDAGHEPVRTKARGEYVALLEFRLGQPFLEIN